jgi:hypothetical protein
VRQLVSISFIAFFILHFSIKTIIVASFYLNQTEIANTLCENNTRPALQCNGKCYLVKQLKKQEKQDDQLAIIVKLISEFTVHTPACVSLLGTQQDVSTRVYTNYAINPYNSYLDAVFRPPACA